MLSFPKSLQIYSRTASGVCEDTRIINGSLESAEIALMSSWELRCGNLTEECRFDIVAARLLSRMEMLGQFGFNWASSLLVQIMYVLHPVALCANPTRQP